MSQKSLPSNPKGAEAIRSKDKSGIYIYIFQNLAATSFT